MRDRIGVGNRSSALSHRGFRYGLLRGVVGGVVLGQKQERLATAAEREEFAELTATPKPEGCRQ